MRIRHYCTYFDHRYLDKGLALINSIRRFGPWARFHILALDEKCKVFLEDLGDPTISVTSLAALEDFDPELLACRADRSLVEYYFTCTPCFPLFLLKTTPGVDIITYLDADLFFFEDPEAVFQEIGEASIAITPHRFLPKNVGLEQFGRFNVGWVSWRNDTEGRRCLEDYRADCLEWCYDRLEGDRFADQKYLDKWPAEYSSLCILDHAGINAAPWNVDEHTSFAFEHRDGMPPRAYVNGILVIFWHFHHLSKNENGKWALYSTLAEEVLAQLYMPYLNILDDLRAWITATSETIRFEHTKIRNISNEKGFEPPQAEAVLGKVPFPGEALGGGYWRLTESEARQTVEAGAADGWHRDSVAQTQARAYANLIAEMKRRTPRRDLAVAAEAVSALKLAHPSLLDVGCGSGYYRTVFEHLVPGGVDYQGIDYSPAMIALARQQDPQGNFAVADATKLPYPNKSFDIVFNGVSLMHILDFRDAIREAARVARRYVILHTAVLRRGGGPVYLGKEAYGGPVVEVILSEAELRRMLAEAGLAVVGIAPSIDYDLGPVLGERTETRTLVCAPVDAMTGERPCMLNVGCGNHFHPAWVNVDIQSQHPGVMAYDILEGLPFPDGVFDLVYHSHVLEHLPGWRAEPFLADCVRLLKTGGILRVAIPDLETICRLYLESLAGALEGDKQAELRYDWMMIELVDQMSRTESGGEMARFWRETPPGVESFVIERVGGIAENYIGAARAGRLPPAPPRRVVPAEEVARFRQAGEVHQWMYDRFSLGRLMARVGLADIRVVDSMESAFPGFTRFRLDADASGCVRKPDSLFMEGIKP